MPSLLEGHSFLNEERGVPRMIVYYKTYMPPTFLSRSPAPIRVKISSTMAKLRRGTSADDSVAELREKDAVDQGRACSDRTRTMDDDCGCVIIDLKGSGTVALRETLGLYLRCDDNGPSSQTSVSRTLDGTRLTARRRHLDDELAEGVYVVAPASAIDCDRRGGSVVLSDDDVDGYECEEVWSRRAHITTEDMPEFTSGFFGYWRSMKLVALRITCSS